MRKVKPLESEKMNDRTYGLRVCKKRNCHDTFTAVAPNQRYCDKHKAVTVAAVPVSANATQQGGDHYKSKAIQPWDFIASNNLGFLEGNIVKYVTRWKDKGGVDDLRKAQHYLQKLIELNQATT